MNRLRVQILMIFVLILGQVACSPDKPIRREDQWRFSPPEILMPATGENDPGRLKVGEASQRELPMTAELSFPSMTPDVVLEIDSLCITNGANFEETFSISATKLLSFGSIVPARALLATSSEPIECSFNFSAVNEHGSRHHFLIPGVKLSDGATYGSLIVSKQLERISPNESSESKILVKVDELDQIAVDSEVESGVAELTCADFTSREQFRSVDTINWNQLAYKQPIEILENVLRKFRQPCRLALKDEHGARVELSALFTLLYPAPKLVISAQTPAFAGPTNEKIRDISILNFKITNESNIDQVLELQNISADPRLVWRARSGPKDRIDSNYHFWFNIHRTADISYAISGADKTFNLSGKNIFAVKAKSEVAVSVIANSYYLNQAPGSIHSGYLFMLPQPLRLKRLEVVGDLDLAIQRNELPVAEEISIFNLPHHASETQIYVPNANVKSDLSFVARNLTEQPFPATGD